MKDVCVIFARCFGTPSGEQVLSHLRKITIDRTLGPNASDNDLRWLESQRSFVHQIENLISQGRGQNDKS